MARRTLAPPMTSKLSEQHRRIGQHTLGRTFCVRRVVVQLQIVAPRDTSRRDQTRRSSHDLVGSEKLTAPPVCTQQSDELGLGIDPLALDTGAALAVMLQLGDHVVRDHADGARRDEDDP